MSPQKRSLNVVHLGGYAKNQFNLFPQGKILAVFSSIIYIITEFDEIFWITSNQFPMHRRSIQIYGQLPKVKVNSKYIVIGNSISIDSTIKIDMDEALTWESPAIIYSNISKHSDINHNIENVMQLILRIPSAKGFGVFLPNIMSKPVIGIEEMSLHTDYPYASKFWSLWTEIISKSIKSDFKLFIKEVINIIGLGIGLTPSGDDFFGGLFFGLKYINEYFPDKYYLNEQVSFEKIKSMTNPISFAIMADMVNGHGVEPLHNLLDGIFIGEGDEQIEKYCRQLLSIGNSTGWDILTGVVTSLIVYENFNKIQSRAIELEEILI